MLSVFEDRVSLRSPDSLGTQRVEFCFKGTHLLEIVTALKIFKA